MTNHDWPLVAKVTGNGFNGPRTLLAKAFQTTKYPLVFRPQNENPIAVSISYSILYLGALWLSTKSFIKLCLYTLFSLR